MNSLGSTLHQQSLLIEITKYCIAVLIVKTVVSMLFSVSNLLFGLLKWKMWLVKTTPVCSCNINHLKMLEQQGYYPVDTKVWNS